MRTIKRYYKSTILWVGIVLSVNACTKENLPPKPSSVDNISNRTIRYTILVVPAGNTGFKSVPKGIDSAFVSLVMNDSIYTKATDVNGLVKFNNLSAGNAAVTIRYANHCTANFIVDLSSKSDTLDDKNNIRNASTMVALFPYSGPGTATISGRTFADLDLTQAGLEAAPSGLRVSSIIEPEQFNSFIQHSGDGKVLYIAYEHTINSASTDSNSDFNLTVPATGSGLKIIIRGDDFVSNQRAASGTLSRKIFTSKSDTVITFSGLSYFRDIKYE